MLLARLYAHKQGEVTPEQQIRQRDQLIKELRAQGLMPKELARKFDISVGRVHQIVSRKKS